MENKIKELINNPQELEKLYQSDKKAFETAFRNVYPEIESNQISEFWRARLDFGKPSGSGISISRLDVIVLIATCAITTFLIKLPVIFGIDDYEFLYYERNAGLIILLGLSIYALWTNKMFSFRQILISAIAFIIPAVYVNVLPSDRESHSLNLVYIHLPLLMWCIYGLIYIGYDFTARKKRIEFLKFNGDLAILTSVILMAGVLLTLITLGLFNAIDIGIEDFYYEYVVIAGLVSAPIVAAYIIKNYPFITNKIAPIIAGIFSPLVLITLIAYLVSVIVSKKDPYNDREFLLVFNMMLLGVMAIIVFSVSETSIQKKQRFREFTLFLLAVVTLLINIVALSAIVYRLSEFGFSPNKTAVLGSNLLVFSNLILIMIDLFKVNFKSGDIRRVEVSIARFLPVYTVWTLIVIFGFPLIFGCR